MTEVPIQTEHKNGLIRQLGMFDSTMMMIGLVIGSGIFLTTGIMIQSLPYPGLILLAWTVGGLLTLTGALTYAELGAAMPEAGGQYVYLRESYGPLVAFLFGWILFLVTMGGSIAALGVDFAEYFGYFFPALSTGRCVFSKAFTVFNHTFHYNLSVGHFVALAVIILLSVFNYIGVVFGKGIQNIVTVVKIGAVLVFVAAGLIAGSGNPVDFSLQPGDTVFSFGRIITAFGVTLVAVTWSFDGWNNVAYAAGEIKNPKRNLPFSLIAGTAIITVLYCLVNYVYFLALPVSEMAGVVRIAEKTATALFGGTSAGFLSAAVLISVFGALNGCIFVGPRVYYAMAKDDLFFRRVSEVHPRFKTPAFSIVVQTIWACILTLTGTFEQLFTYIVFITVLFYVLTASSIFILRKKRPDMPRPYKTWGYPVIPLIFIIVYVVFMINTLLEKPVESLAGALLTVIGIPVYYYWKNSRQRKG